MKKKFLYLVKCGFLKKVKTKSFWISNIVLLVLLLLVTNLDTIIEFFGGDFDDNVHIYVIDHTDVSYPLFAGNYQMMSGLEEEEKIEITLSEEERSKLEENLEDNDILVELSFNEEDSLEASVTSRDYIDTLTYQSIVQSIQSTKYTIALQHSNIDEEELAKIESPVEIERIILNEEKSGEDENTVMLVSSVFPVVILPFFMLIILVVQMIGSEINEEKTTRSMEVIISNVSPKVHFYSKLLASNLFVIMQGVLLFLYGALGLVLHHFTSTSQAMSQSLGEIFSLFDGTSIVSQLPYLIPILILLMILSFIAYSLLAGIFASMTVSAEDFQQVQTPLMLILLSGYYLSMMAGMFQGSLFIRILSYVPLISCLLSPTLLVLGQIGLIDALISVLVMILFIFVMTKYGLRVYKVGILNYSTDKLWKRMFKAIKNS